MSWQRWISISLVLGMLLLAFGLIMPAVFQAREAARRNSAKNNLKQIGLALFNYHESYRCLPPGGTIREDDTAMQGWIAMMMPFLDASPYYSWLDFNESWQSAANRYVFDQRLHVVLIPGVEQHYSDSGFGVTQIMGNPNLLHRNSDVTFEEMTNGEAGICCLRTGISNSSRTPLHLECCSATMRHPPLRRKERLPYRKKFFRQAIIAGTASICSPIPTGGINILYLV